MAVSELNLVNQQNAEGQTALSQSGSKRSAVDESAFLRQIERILQSDELRGSDSLRQLLKFLADRYVSGAADDLKEYSIAIEALGKPTSYDPRHNSAVRILAGRLRQKLTNYYLVEGQHDQVLVDLPKGHFKLTCVLRESSVGTGQNYSGAAPSVSTENPTAKSYPSARKALMAAVWVLVGFVLAVVGEAALHRGQVGSAKNSNLNSPRTWDPSVEELWKPFIATDRPVIMAVGSPLFVALDVKKGILYRGRNLTWDDAVSSPEVKAIRALVKGDRIEPIHYYNAFGATQASFMLSKLLGSRVQNLSVARTTDLSMQEVADNNIIFVGNQSLYFSQQIHASPVEPLLQPMAGGIRNLHPQGDEPEMFVDQYSEAPTEEGFAYALVTHLPGPLGGNDVESFSSSRAAGYVAAAKAFTDPEFVRPVLAKLKEAGGGQLPRYYQVLLKVQFKTEVPTEITCVLTRTLDYTNKK